MPEFVTQGLIDHDYTMLVMRRYAEAMKTFWTEIIRKVKSQSNKTLNQIAEFQKNEVRSFRESRKNFETNQTKYDAVLARYASVAKNKEPSSLREDAFQLSEARKSYIKSSFDICCIIATVQRQLDTLIIDSLTEPWLLKSNSLGLSDPIFHHIGIDMHRIKSWSKAVSTSLKPIETEMFRVRKEMEESTIAKTIPSRDLSDYTSQNATISHFVPDSTATSDEKHGWLFVKTSTKPSRQMWTRRWGFVKNGMFGWLVLSPNKTFVQESDKIGVLLCNVSPEPNEERRFCFEIRTKDNTIIVQAETLSDLKSWLQVFEVSKRKVVQKEKNSDMSFAFQRLHPLFPEFSSADNELVHARSHSDSSNNYNNGQNSGGGGQQHQQNNSNNPQSSSYNSHQNERRSSMSLLGNQEAQNIQELMVSGKSVLLPSYDDNQRNKESQFSTIGPYSVSLAPSPLLNPPMPTSMTAESIIANAFVLSNRVPTAVTANYWGSVNWGLYQTNSTGQLAPRQEAPSGVSLQNVATSSSASDGTVAPLIDQKYPDYYPNDLRSQDVQMRAIFQNLTDDDPMDRVVLVFRAMIAPNPKQELPSRVFVTTRNMYMYSHMFGFAGLVKKPLSAFLSVEGHAGTSWDTLYLMTEDGTSGMCRIFLDSGRVIQKRLQFLIDSLHDKSHSDDLKWYINKLTKIGSETKKLGATMKKNSDSQLPDTNEDLSPLDDDDDNNNNNSYNDDDDKTTNKKLMHKYLVAGNRKGKTSTSRESMSSSVATSNMTSGTQIDLSSTMDKKVVDKEYDISAKALFHVVFGDNSPVFRYTDSSLYSRDKLVIPPWRVNNAGKMEREISYFLLSNGVLMGSSGNDENATKVANLQRIEKMEDDLSYIVYDRRTPWELPHGDVFYIASRFVINSTGKTKARISVYVSVEWIRSRTLMKNVVESLVYHHFTIEAKTISRRIGEARDKLGRRGMAVTAARLFGRIGGARQDDTNNNSQSIDESNPPVATVYSSTDKSTGRANSAFYNRPLTISRYGFCQAIYEFFSGWLISVLSSVVMLATGGLEKIWKEVSLHRFILLGLFASIGLNFFLGGVATKNYWTEQSAINLSKNIRVIPGSESVMKRSLYTSDMDDFIKEGSALADEPSGSCYQKFKSLAYLAPFDNENMDISDYDVIPSNEMSNLDRRSIAFSRKIHKMRNEVGFRRNKLLITMKMVDRIEREMLLSEWRNWLASELELCSNVKKDIALMGKNDSNKDELYSLYEYCNNCETEWGITFKKI